ncbi:hypothetical protein DRO38_04660 [Candidatus Bathyarchaeota archaeon]|nr:MAG: hypothetical protein DRO38_04660 [Candidatus Bathyarchaeota archaeon]
MEAQGPGGAEAPCPPGDRVGVGDAAPRVVDGVNDLGEMLEIGLLAAVPPPTIVPHVPALGGLRGPEALLAAAVSIVPDVELGVEADHLPLPVQVVVPFDRAGLHLNLLLLKVGGVRHQVVEAARIGRLREDLVLGCSCKERGLPVVLLGVLGSRCVDTRLRRSHALGGPLTVEPDGHFGNEHAHPGHRVVGVLLLDGAHHTAPQVLQDLGDVVPDDVLPTARVDAVTAGEIRRDVGDLRRGDPALVVEFPDVVTAVVPGARGAGDEAVGADP